MNRNKKPSNKTIFYILFDTWSLLYGSRSLSDWPSLF